MATISEGFFSPHIFNCNWYAIPAFFFLRISKKILPKPPDLQYFNFKIYCYEVKIVFPSDNKLKFSNKCFAKILEILRFPTL